jgi:L-cysteine desulfidase
MTCAQEAAIGKNRYSKGDNMQNTINDAYVRIIHDELVAAMGCTEPIAIAYCAAKAVQVLGTKPERLYVAVSGNIIKNVKGVVVPNSGGRKGIAAAAVLGAIGGDPSRGLEVIAGVTREARELTATLLDKRTFCLCSVLESPDNLHIVVTAEAEGHSATVEIRGEHTRIVRIQRDGETIFSDAAKQPHDAAPEDELIKLKETLSVEGILAFADTVDLELVRAPLEAQIISNTRIAMEGLKNDYGVRVGKTLLHRAQEDDVTMRARAAAAAGSDARMSGCALPVVINSGSGNQGITVSMPVIEYARDMNASHDKLLRALIVSNLISIHQKRFLGSLSAYCGATSAACGAVCGVAYLCGYGYNAIANTITNTIANIGGMVCDGAKPSCAAKIASALDAAFMAFDLQQNGDVFAPGEGLVQADVEKTIRAVGQMGREGMKATDSEILDIMMGE